MLAKLTTFNISYRISNMDVPHILIIDFRSIINDNDTKIPFKQECLRLDFLLKYP